MPDFLKDPPRILFFTGKGGVGKTSLACASALALAERGRRVLLVSTDPASNLDEVLATPLANEPRAIAGCSALSALNIDPQAAAASYREGVVGPLRGLMPDAVVRNIEESLSGACTVEIAAFDRFCQLLTDPAQSADVDHVIFDTAPTGHTLRLLKLPAAWDGFLASNTTGTTCIGPLAGLATQRATYERALRTLGDPTLTLLVLVARPDAMALREAARTAGELAAEGIAHQHLVINGVPADEESADDPLARAMVDRAAAALRDLPPSLAKLPCSRIGLAPVPPLGLAGLRALLGAPPTGDEAPPPALLREPAHLATLIDQLAARGHGVVMTAGKGGVGKTTLASVIAVGLAARGGAVHLTTTDPAAHLALALGDTRDQTAGERLTVGRIDPEHETARYRAEVLANAGAGLDDHGRALLEEDLRSPCTEEIAVFRAFARAIAGGGERFVVVDTAPTGHTLLLLDAAEAYHRDVEKKLAGLPPEVAELLPRLRDPDYTRVLLVTLPEATPVHEAMKLRDDLARAGIAPWGWVINQSLHGHTPQAEWLQRRQRGERPYLNEVLEEADRVALLPWQIAPPVGRDALARLAVA